MKRKCSICSVWVLSSCSRKINAKLYDHAVEKKVKIDESSSFICQSCYKKLYKHIDTMTEEPITGPSSIGTTGMLYKSSYNSVLI